MAAMIRVLIADDHPVVLDGLQAALTNQPDIVLAGLARDGTEAEKLALQVKPDVILMDISMPRRGGFETMLSIKLKLLDVKFLILTVSEQDEDLLQAIRLGANGYLSKKVDRKEIVNAIRRVFAGEAILSSAMTIKLMHELKKKGTEPSLSKREEEILGLLAEGLTTVEIASRLYLSEGTISTYACRLLNKLHLKNRAEAIAYAARHMSKKT